MSALKRVILSLVITLLAVSALPYNVKATLINLDDCTLRRGAFINDYYYDEYGVTFDGLTLWDEWNYAYVPKKYPGDKAGIPMNAVLHGFTLSFETPISSFSFLSATNRFLTYYSRVIAYSNGTEIYNQPFDTGEGHWYYTSITFDAPVDFIKIQTAANRSIFDNFEFAPASPAPVPEPATVILFGSGLVGVCLGRFRKAKR